MSRKIALLAISTFVLGVTSVVVGAASDVPSSEAKNEKRKIDDLAAPDAPDVAAAAAKKAKSDEKIAQILGVSASQARKVDKVLAGKAAKGNPA